MQDHNTDDSGVARFALLASAVAGLPLEVAAGEQKAPAWTDGRTVFVDPEVWRDHAR
jgi:nitric oxide reductase NorD protein